MKIEIAKIEIGERLRDVCKSAVELIAASFRDHGQLTPILVRLDGPKPRLVAGLHRIEAAKLIGWSHIEAEGLKLDGLKPDRADVVCAMAEVDENLARNDLDQAERCVFVHTKVRLTNEKVGGDQRKKVVTDDVRRVSPKGKTPQHSNGRLTSGVAAEIARQTGLKSKTIHNAHYFAERLGIKLLQAVAGTRLATKGELQALVNLKKKAPEDAAGIIRSIMAARKQGRAPSYSPSVTLGEIEKRERAAAKDDAMKSREGRLTIVAEALREALSKCKAARQAWNGLPAEDRNKIDLRRLLDLADSASTVANALAKPPTQKCTGHETKYLN